MVHLTFKKMLVYLTLIFLAQGLGSAASTSNTCFITNNGRFEERSFDPITQLCCNEQILHKNGINRGCCGGNTPYNKDREICCNGSTYPMMSTEGQTQYCCGSRPFVVDGTSVCCEGNLLKSTETGSCCGPNVINKEDEICCFDISGNTSSHSRKENHICCGTLYFDTTTHVCRSENRVTLKDHDTCGAQQFDPRYQSCCHGNIINEPMNIYDQCCGTQKYNQQYSSCCSNTVIPKNQRCCAGVPMTSSQRCCLNNVMNITSPSQACCGGNLFDPQNGEDCCTGGKVFNTTTTKCCGHSLIGIDDRCCGSRVYSSSSVCCNNEYVIPKQQPEDDSCCSATHQENGKSYDSSRKRCTIEYGIPRVISKVPLCGSTEYNKADDLCCNNKLHSNYRRDGKECCFPGTEAYHPELEICCNSEVFDKIQRTNCKDPATKITARTTTEEVDTIFPVDNGFGMNDNSGICRICHITENETLQDLKDGSISVCHDYANKFKIKRERRIRKNWRYIGKTGKNFIAEEITTKYKRVHIPCDCQINQEKIIIITDKSKLKSKLLLDDDDIVIPYSDAIQKQIIKIHKLKCKRTAEVKEMINDLKAYLVYLQRKVNKLEKKLTRS